MNELVEKQDTDIVNSAPSMLEIIERAASNPDVDVNKMSALLDMQERVMNKQAEIDFNESMNRLQLDMPSITKEGKVEYWIDKNDHSKGKELAFKFASFENIMKTIKPSLQKEGFTISFDSEQREGGGAVITATLYHIGGHSKKASFAAALDTGGGKNNIQAMGSTFSYGKRYCVTALLNIITEGEDDDAQNADPISEAQVDHLHMLLNETGIDAAKICNYANSESIPEIQVGKFDSVVKRLMERKKQKEREENETSELENLQDSSVSENDNV